MLEGPFSNRIRSLQQQNALIARSAELRQDDCLSTNELKQKIEEKETRRDETEDQR
jgi:hypothetical protein